MKPTRLLGLSALGWTLACGGLDQTPAPSEVAPTPAPTAADYSEIAGYWRGEGWGSVVFQDNHGTYTDTFSGSPGTLEVHRTADRTYEGTWGESARRHGTLQFTVSTDGEHVNGTYLPDPDCKIGDFKQGPFRLSR
jgi:hypothetical protein